MSAPNPLIPQGTFQAHAAKGASNVRLAVATIVGIHIVFFGGLLLQGCKRDPKLADSSADTNSTPTNGLSLPPIDTSSLYYSTGALPADATSGVANNSQLSGVPQPDPGDNPEALWQSNTAGGQALANEAGPMKEYTVVSGDSYGRIAARNKTTVNALRKANPGIDPLKIRPGQKINLPAPTQTTEATTLNNSGATANADTSSGTGTIYTVKSGDTLTRIAERHGTTVRQIRQANNLATSRVNIGQKLKIPAKNTATNTTGANQQTPQAF